MKKQIVLFIAAVMTVGLVAGCGTKNTTNEKGNGTTTGNNTTNETNQNDNKENMQTTETTANHKLGLGVISRMKNATHAGDTDGAAELETVIAAVTVDAEDRIVNCKIDMVEHSIPISNTGAIGTQANTEYQTKKELGNNYGMAGASGIGKEWYEQIEAFEKQVVGMTMNEINGIKTDEAGYAQEENWNTSVTISITDFQAAITKAVENAK